MAAVGIKAENCTMMYESTCATFEAIRANQDEFDKQYRESGEDVLPLRYVTIDVGGGTSDVTSGEVTLGDSEGTLTMAFNVDRIGGDEFCGGMDITNKIVDNIMEQLEDEGVDMEKYDQLDKVLQAEFDKMIYEKAEGMKVKIGSKRIITEKIRVPFQSYKTVDISLTQKDFKEICEAILDKVKYDVIQIYESKDVGFVVLAGGCNEIPTVQEIFASWIPDDNLKILTTTNRREMIANGATRLGKAYFMKSKYIKFNDCVGYRLSVQMSGDRSYTLIDKNEALPLNKEFHEFVNSGDTDTLSVRIFEGDSNKASENEELAVCTLKLDKQYKARKAALTIEFDINDAGICRLDCNLKNNKAIKGNVEFNISHFDKRKGDELTSKVTTIREKQRKTKKMREDIQSLKKQLRSQEIFFDKQVMRKFGDGAEGLQKQLEYLNDVWTKQKNVKRKTKRINLNIGAKRKFKNMNDSNKSEMDPNNHSTNEKDNTKEKTQPFKKRKKNGGKQQNVL